MSLPDRLALALDVLASLVPVALAVLVVASASYVLADLLDAMRRDRKVTARDLDQWTRERGR